MRILRRKFTGISRSDKFTVVPLGDLHVGAKACDEELLRRVVRRIAVDPTCYWVGMGDMCLPLEAEILTKRGFLRYNQLKSSDEVLAYDGKNTVWTSLLGVYITPEVPFIHLKSKSFDVTCSPNHKWIVNDIHGNRKRRQKTIDSWPRKVRTADLKQSHKIILAAECLDPGSVDISCEEAELLGWLITDGCLVSESKKRFRASISQAKEPYRSEIRAKFFHWFTNEYDRGRISVFNIKVQKLRKLFKRLGLKHSSLKEQMPQLVTRLPPLARKAMLKAMLEAEGWQERGHWRFSQKPGPVLDAFCILATLEGFRLGLGKFNKGGVKTIPILDYRPQVGVADIKFGQVDSGAAWCPQTNYGSWVTRLDRQIAITGNCEYINTSDPRFDPLALADWIGMDDLVDLAAAQSQYLLGLLNPILHKCLALLEGNHELRIKRVYERDVYRDLVLAVKAAAGLKPDEHVGMGGAGYLRLAFYRSKKGTGGGRVITFCMHHGFASGRLAGGKALALERWMWQHDADVTLMAHCHDEMTKKVAVEYVTRSDKLARRQRIGAYTGSFLRGTIEEVSTYSEVKGYPPNAPGCPEIHIWPGLKGGPRIGILHEVEL